MSTTIIIDANTIADTAMISAMRVNGVLHFTLASRKIAVINDPTRLMATKKNEIGNINAPGNIVPHIGNYKSFSQLPVVSK